MTWRITEDHLSSGDDSPSRVGYFEEHSRIPVEAVMLGFESEPLPSYTFIPGPFAPIKKGLPLVKFRLYDDDGELYYEGELHDDDECINQSAALSWAEGDAGCTTIKVLRGGEWTLEIG